MAEPGPHDLIALWEEFHRQWEARQNVVASEYHAMAIRQGKSGQPDDVFVNNFTFIADDDKVTAADDISAALIDFYETTGPTLPINAYRGMGVEDLMTFKIYKLSDLKPREPLVRVHTTAISRANSGSLPEEVAICLSFSASAPHTARRRGRVYLGPLNPAVCTEEAVTGICRISGAAQANIAAAAVRLSNHVDAGWLIHSTVGAGAFSEVVTGWVDNAFDTQRRRGPKASTRFTWAQS